MDRSRRFVHASAHRRSACARRTRSASGWIAPLLALGLCLAEPGLPGTASSTRGCGILPIFSGAVAWAQTGVGGRPPVPPPPVDFDAGFDTRIREETLHNLLDLNDSSGPAAPLPVSASDASYFRVRHRLWGQLVLRSGPRLYSRFTAEWRKYVQPWTSPAKTEVILDNLYLDLPRLAGAPISLRIGRQDLSRGEGFILLEGGPLDGSRSIYQNAVLLGLDGQPAGLGKTKLELMAIRNLAWDEFVVTNGPTQEERAKGQRRMVENDETAFGLYVTNTNLKSQTLEGYYFYKEEEAPAAKDPQMKLHTAGARAAGSLPAGVSFALEGACQLGTHDPLGCTRDTELAANPCGIDHRSLGGYLWFSRAFLSPLHPTLKLGALYLSGDDPSDSERQDWVPIFSRWPKWSELYIYTLITESGRVANWTNLSSLNAALSLQVTGSMKFSYTYHYLRAPQSLNGRSPLFGSGHLRGHNHQWLLTADVSRSVTWHFLVERFAPGDFYSPESRDDAYFLRWELMIKN